MSTALDSVDDPEPPSAATVGSPIGTFFRAVALALVGGALMGIWILNEAMSHSFRHEFVFRPEDVLWYGGAVMQLSAGTLFAKAGARARQIRRAQRAVSRGCGIVVSYLFATATVALGIWAVAMMFV